MDTIRVFLRSKTFRSSRRKEEIIRRSFSRDIQSVPIECDTHRSTSNEQCSSNGLSSNIDPLQSHLPLISPHLDSSSSSTPSLRSPTAMAAATCDSTGSVRSRSPTPAPFIDPSVDLDPPIRGHSLRRRSSLTVDVTLASPCSVPSSFRRTQSHRYSNRMRNYSNESKETPEKFKVHVHQVKTHHRLHFKSISYVHSSRLLMSLCLSLANESLHFLLARTRESRRSISSVCQSTKLKPSVLDAFYPLAHRALLSLSLVWFDVGNDHFPLALSIDLLPTQ